METKGQGGYSVSRSLPEVVQRAQTGRVMTMQRAVVTNLTAGRDLMCPWQGGVNNCHHRHFHPGRYGCLPTERCGQYVFRRTG